jgi:hypothetical protein
VRANTFRPHYDLVEAAFASYSRAVNQQTHELERSCMKKAVFAGAIAFALMGPLFVSESGLGPTQASAQEVAVTAGKIARLRAALRLRGEQIAHWRPVEAALRAAMRPQYAEASTTNDGWVQRTKTRVRGYVNNASALQQAYAAAGPLIASLDERQRASGRNALRAMGGASMF